MTCISETLYFFSLGGHSEGFIILDLEYPFSSTTKLLKESGINLETVMELNLRSKTLPELEGCASNSLENFSDLVCAEIPEIRSSIFRNEKAYFIFVCMPE